MYFGAQIKFPALWSKTHVGHCFMTTLHICALHKSPYSQTQLSVYPGWATFEPVTSTWWHHWSPSNPVSDGFISSIPRGDWSKGLNQFWWNAFLKMTQSFFFQYNCGEFTLADCQVPTRLLLLPLLNRTGEEKTVKSSCFQISQGDHLPITIMGKTALTQGKLIYCQLKEGWTVRRKTKN